MAVLRGIRFLGDDGLRVARLLGDGQWWFRVLLGWCASKVDWVFRKVAWATGLVVH